jgi:hypothetical protein
MGRLMDERGGKFFKKPSTPEMASMLRVMSNRLRTSIRDISAKPQKLIGFSRDAPSVVVSRSQSRKIYAPCINPNRKRNQQ